MALERTIFQSTQIGQQTADLLLCLDLSSGELKMLPLSIALNLIHFFVFIVNIGRE